MRPPLEYAHWVVEREVDKCVVPRLPYVKANMSQKADTSQQQGKSGGPQVTEPGLRQAKVKNHLRVSGLLPVKAALENAGEMRCDEGVHASLDGWEYSRSSSCLGLVSISYTKLMVGRKQLTQ